MKTTVIILFLGLLVLEGHGQTSEKQHIFFQNDTVNLGGRYDSMVRFTPSINEVNTADSLAEIHIKKNRKDYSWTTEISDYKSYYRQYVGYLNEKNKKIIFINSFCRPEKLWTKYLLLAMGGGSCWFNIKVNLDAKDTFDFNVNAPK